MKRYNPYKKLTNDELSYVVGGSLTAAPDPTVNPGPLPTGTIAPGPTRAIILPCQAGFAVSKASERAPIIANDCVPPTVTGTGV